MIGWRENRGFLKGPRARGCLMRWLLVVRVVALLVPLTWAGGTWGADAPQASPANPRTGITVWDTGRPAAEALAPAALAGKNDWAAIPPGETADSLKGDAVLSNGRIVAVLRKQDSAVEVHAVKRGGTVARLRLRLMTAAGEPAARLERMAVVENTKGGACLEATFADREGRRGHRQVPHQAGRCLGPGGAGDRGGQAPCRMPGSLRRPARFLRR